MPAERPSLFSSRCRHNLTFSSLPVQPSIRLQSSVVYSTLGKSTHLRCSGQVPFDGTFFWSRSDNQSLTNQTQRFRQYHTYADVAQTSLLIRDVEKSDFGFYTCRTESMAGHSEATVELKGNYILNGSFFQLTSLGCGRIASFDNSLHSEISRANDTAYTNTQTKSK